MKNIGEIAANAVLIGIALTPVVIALGQLAGGALSAAKAKPRNNEQR